jgi:hypothetical protein
MHHLTRSPWGQAQREMLKESSVVEKQQAKQNSSAFFGV